MFGRIARLITGFLSLFIKGLEIRNPEALLEAAVEDSKKSMKQYNEGMAIQAGLVERLKTQKTSWEKHERELKSKITANIAAGNTELAGQLAIEYKRVVDDLKSNKDQYDEAEQTYQKLNRARANLAREIQQKVDSVKSGINKMKINKATAELHQMASTMIGQISGNSDGLSRIQELVDEESEKHAGRARVARDSMDTTSIDMKDAEQKAMANAALADFAAEQGITLPSTVTPQAETNSAGSTEKVIGINS